MPLVRLRAVTASYGGRAALAPVSADVDAGRVLAVTGANGAGKSTLLAVLAGLHPPATGALEWDGGVAPRVALAVQRTAAGDALALTVRELVTMGRWAHRLPWSRVGPGDRGIVDDVLERLALRGLARRPLGELSGGQRQRALVGRAIAQRAGLVLLDEPATGLDAVSRRLIDDVLRREAERGAAVVHATHDDASIGASDAELRLGAVAAISI